MNNEDEYRQRFFSKARTKEDIVFDPNEDVWCIKDPFLSHCFKFLDLPFKSNHLYGLKRLFVYYLENYSLYHCANIYQCLKLLLKHATSRTGRPLDTITKVHLKNFKSFLGERNEWKLGTQSAFLKKWHKMGFEGVSEDAYQYLNKVTIKGNVKGERVLSQDPEKGPFSELEEEGMIAALKNFYADGKITVEDYVLIRLLRAYGQRIGTYAHLKVCDVKTKRLVNGETETSINLPLLKKRGAKFREAMLERPVPPSFANILVEHAESVSKAFNDILDDPNLAPLFPDLENDSNDKNAYHHQPRTLGKRVEKIIASLQVISEMTREPIHGNTQRFRDTLGTRMAEEGHGVLIIAEALGHADTQSAGVYIDALTDVIGDKLDEKLAMYLAPLAQRFAGKLAERDESLPGMDILFPKASDKSTGKCGTHSFCGLMAPIACYTCSSFTAWDDGPHEQILFHLLKERARVKKVSGAKIASINDQTILAVNQVVIDCKVKKDADYNPDFTLLTQ
jgi:integrase